MKGYELWSAVTFYMMLVILFIVYGSVMYVLFVSNPLLVILSLLILGWIGTGAFLKLRGKKK